MSATSPYRRGLIARIKIAQKDLGLDEDTYRAMLLSLTGRDSCADLSDRQLVFIIAHLREKGWTGDRGRAEPRPKVSPELERLRSKIGAMLASMNKDWSYADGILSRMYGIAGVSWANRVQLTACIAALNKQTQRVAKAAETAEVAGA